MKTMKKIVAILAVALLLCSMLPLSVMAADTTVVFELGANGSASHADGTSKTTYSETVSGYTLTLSNVSNFYTGARDAKGNSCIKLGASSKAGGFSFTVPSDVTSVIIAAGKYKSNTTKLKVNSTTHTLTKNSNDGAYDAITVDTTTNKTITLTTVSGGYRAMINSITFVIPAGGCIHEWELISTTDATCTNAGEEYYECSACGESKTEAIAAKGHSYGEATETVAPTCTTAGEKQSTCSACGDVKTEVVNALPHSYVDGVCADCGAEQPAEYTITFDANKTQRTELTTTKQVWKNGPLTFTNNKGASTTNVADYSNPVRLYAKSQVVIECPGMTKIDFVCGGSSYVTALKNSLDANANIVTNGNTVTVTLDATDDTYTIEKLTAQVQLKSITVYSAAPAQSDCEHENAKECDVYCPDCGELISEGATHVSDAEFPCYEGKCVYCDEVIAAVDHVLDENDVCTVCGMAPTPEKPVDPENPQKYVFSDFAAGTQYAVNEKHFLDNAVTVITSQAHFTEELRIYSSDTYNATVIIKSKKDISAIVLNAGKNADVLNLYVSEGGEVYKTIEVASAYKEYTVLIPEMTKYIKLDVAGDQQVRIKDMTLYFDGEAPSVCTEHVYTGDYDATCNNCGETTRTVSFPEADSVLTIPEITAIANGMDDKTKTDSKYYVIGKITEIDNDEYGNMYITTDGTDSLYIYGTYDATGDNRFDAMAEKPVVGNIVKLYGKIGPYDGTAQMQYAWIIEVTCAHEYDSACDVDCNLCGEAREVQHSVQHVEAKAATCAANGNIEYWYCDVCGMAWLDEACAQNTNLKAVVLPATGEHTYFDDCSAICEVCGFEREVSHNIVNVEAVAATCAANGNLEYWYCDVCGMAWLNAECTLNTNLRAVITPATGEHTYDDEYDADCNVCGDIREVPEKPVETVYGDVNGDSEIDILDEALLSQFINNWDVTLDEIAADVNCDGEIDILDEALLSQFINNWDVTLGPIEPDDQGPLFNDGTLTDW